MWACLGSQSGPGKLPASPATNTRSGPPATRQYSSALMKPPRDLGSSLFPSHVGPVSPGMNRIRSAFTWPPSVSTPCSEKPNGLWPTWMSICRRAINAGKLGVWLKDAHQSGLYAMQRFARTLRRDIDAVRNAVTEQWSNGQTEGQINRLKTLKRAMYGRAGPELLRARMLPA